MTLPVPLPRGLRPHRRLVLTRCLPDLHGVSPAPRGRGDGRRRPEIGVHHGLSAIGVAALRGEGHRFVAIDLFGELQAQNTSGSGNGDREHFIANMQQFHEDLSFLTTLTARSATLRRADLGSGFSFCHIDGGHSAAEAYADLRLCSEVAAPGGLIALDDYFNPAFPGVGEAAVRFSLDHPGTLRPIAIGSTRPCSSASRSHSISTRGSPRSFPRLRRQRRAVGTASSLVQHRVRRLLRYGTLDATTADTRTRASGARPHRTGSRHHHRTGRQTVSVPVQVTNLSHLPLAQGSSPFGLSYHVMTPDHQLLQFDHPREWFTEPLPPGASRTMHVRARGAAGTRHVPARVRHRLGGRVVDERPR